jgi:hypothetical protein
VKDGALLGANVTADRAAAYGATPLGAAAQALELAVVEELRVLGKNRSVPP